MTFQSPKAVLRDNNYLLSFIQDCERALTKQPTENNFNGFVVLPYVQGVSEKIGRILKQQKVKVAYKSQLTINSLFPRPKEQDESDRQKSGIVYKINCTQCNFVYYGKTERPLKTRTAEHKKAVAGFDQNSKVASHVHHSSHNMDFENDKVVGFEVHFHFHYLVMCSDWVGLRHSLQMRRTMNLSLKSLNLRLNTV